MVSEREHEKMKITYFLRDEGACGYYRADLPMQAIKDNTEIEVGRIKKGDQATEIEEHLDADIYLIPRASDEQMLKVMGRLQADGKRVIIDFDDDMFNISPLSPHYEENGIEEVKVRLPDGEMKDLWVDGKNINIEKNKKRREDIILCCQRADIITVTTDILAEAYEPLCDDVRVLPNCIDPSVYQKLPFEKRDTIRVGWTGGSSHYEDICLLKEVLPYLMDKYKNMVLVVFGQKFEGMMKGLPADRVEYHEWVERPAYPYKLAILDLDIMLIPIIDNVFNRRKSPIKWMESSLLGIPCVMSDISPYKDVQADNNGIYIEGNYADSWIKGVSYLADNPLEGSRMAFESNLIVLDKFNIHTRYKQWVDAYEIPKLEVV